MRWMIFGALMLALLLGGGCRGKANAPGDEEQLLQTQYSELAVELASLVNATSSAVNDSDWAQVDELISLQEDLFQGLINIEVQLAALGASPDMDLGSIPGLEVAPPPPTDEYDTPEGQARVDSLWVVINLIEDAIHDAVAVSDQELVDDLLQNREPYMQELFQLIGKPASG